MGYREIPVGTEKCLGCNGAVEEGTAICPICGAPIDVSQFAELELELKPLLRQARSALAVATGIFAVCFLLLASLMASPATLVTAAFGMALFGGCCLLSAWRPLAASVIALSVFSALQIAVIAQGHLWMLFQGAVIVALKVILFVLLLGGVKAGLRIRDIRRQTRPRDRKIGAALIAATMIAGVTLGLWVRSLEASAYAAYQIDDGPDTMDAVTE
jgi:hypothetical protein